MVIATGVAILSCKLRTRPDAAPGFARPNARRPRTVLVVAAAKARANTQVDAAAVNEGASQDGCAVKLSSLGFTLLHEVSRVQGKSTKLPRHKTQDRLDKVTPIGARGAAR